MRICQNIMSKIIKRFKRILLMALALVMAFSLTSCGSKKSRYQAYIRGLITANYLGIPSEYVKVTGSSEEDAESLYLQNVTRLADNLSSYFGLDISGDEELAPAMVDLSKQIYGKVKFEVGEAYKDNNINYVDVTIYPINILNQVDPDILEYIEQFNQAIEAGTYNNYTKDEYEYEFASGIIGILADAVSDIEYADPVTVKVRIITSDDSFYIGNEDFKNLDMAMIATDETGSYDYEEEASEGDAYEEESDEEEADESEEDSGDEAEEEEESEDDSEE